MTVVSSPWSAVSKIAVGFSLGALLFAICVSAEAQQSGKAPRVGYLTNDSVSADAQRRDAFRQGLRELGYSEGQNIVIEYRTAGGKPEILPALAVELRTQKVEVVFAFTTAAAQAARHEMPTVPIVAVTPDPVVAGLVASLAHPGGIVTGLSTTPGPEIYGKYIELLKEIVPTLKLVAILSNSTNPFNPPAVKEIETLAPALKVSLQVLDARAPNDLETAFAAAKRERAGGMVVAQDTMFLAQRARLAELAAKNRLPAIYAIPEHADAGGLMAYAANRLEIFRRAATYIDKIIKGAKPGDLPIEQPTKFELIINLKAAKQIGLTIPPNVLARADKVIK
jgi:putative tryptophan/tyrosine transport system substrate-binding protein